MGWLWLIVRLPFVCYFVEWVACGLIVRLPFVCYSVEWVACGLIVRLPFVCYSVEWVGCDLIVEFVSRLFIFLLVCLFVVCATGGRPTFTVAPFLLNVSVWHGGTPRYRYGAVCNGTRLIRSPLVNKREYAAFSTDRLWVSKAIPWMNEEHRH